MSAVVFAFAAAVSVAAAGRPFTCKERTMHGLSADEEVLAHDGVIGPALRSRSPVFYWRHTRQRRSRREAVCTKDAGWHMASFGSHGVYLDQAAWKCNRVNSRGSPKIDSCVNASIASLPGDWKLQHHVNVTVRGAGYWKWKPYYLLRRLEELRAGDVLVHLDYDLTIRTNLSALFCLGQNARKGVALFHFPCWTDREWSKAELAAELNATDEMLDTAQIYAGVVVLRKTPSAVAFLREWLRVATTGSLSEDAPQWLGGQHPRFVEHRHDQSILSLLSKRRGIKTFPMPTAEHDTRDVWAWDAGFCDAAWPLEDRRGGEAYLPSPFGYVTHYAQMGGLENAARACQRTAGRLTRLPDYVDGDAVLRKITLTDRVQRKIERRGGVRNANRARAWPRQCGATLVAQESVRARCVPNETFGCLRAHLANGTALGDAIWIEGGCRGWFRCEAGVEVRCGRPGHPQSLAMCVCTPGLE